MVPKFLSAASQTETVIVRNADTSQAPAESERAEHKRAQIRLMQVKATRLVALACASSAAGTVNVSHVVVTSELQTQYPISRHRYQILVVTEI